MQQRFRSRAKSSADQVRSFKRKMIALRRTVVCCCCGCRRLGSARVCSPSPKHHGNLLRLRPCQPSHLRPIRFSSAAQPLAGRPNAEKYRAEQRSEFIKKISSIRHARLRRAQLLRSRRDFVLLFPPSRFELRSDFLWDFNEHAKCIQTN